MKTRQQLLVTLFMAMLMSTRVMGQEAYAVLSDDGKKLTFYYDTNKSSYGDNAFDALNTGNTPPGWYKKYDGNGENPNRIEEVKFTYNFKNARPTSTYWWFCDQENLTSINLEYLNTTEVTNMTHMFGNCRNLSYLWSLGLYGTNNVTSLCGMFFNCEKLKSIDLRDCDTSKVEDMSEMFYNCQSLTFLRIDELSTSKVKNMSYMFCGCTSLTSLDLRNFDTSNVINMKAMFANMSQLNYLDVSSFNTAKVTNMEKMFYQCCELESPDVSCFNTRNVTNMNSMFSRSDNLKSLNLSGFDTSSVVDMSKMFSYSNRLTTICVGNKWNTQNLSSSETESGAENGWVDMFKGCTNLKGEQGTTFDSNHTGKEYAHLDGVGGKGYLTSPPLVAYAVLSDNGKTLTFYYDTNKSSYGTDALALNIGNKEPRWHKELIVDNINTSYPTTINPNKIERVVFTSPFKDARPQTTYEWFYEQESLTTIEGINYLNTSEVTNMARMFGYCKLLSLDLSGFNTSNVINMDNMFSCCSNLTSLDVSSFDTSNVTTMSHMFMGCGNLTSLDVSSFDTSNVTGMDYMFDSCNSLTSLDISSFSTSKIYRVDNMFGGCRNLVTIYVGDQWNLDNGNSIHASSMFGYCYNIKGEKGTTFEQFSTGKEYAHIDGGESNPGYLTNATNLIYDLKVAGTPVTGANRKDILGNSVFSYSPGSKTLSVKGSYRYTDNDIYILSGIDGLIIDVKQDAELNGSASWWPLIQLENGTTTFKGSGKLTLQKLQETGIFLKNNASAIIENMDLEIDALWGIAGPRNSEGREKLTIKSSNVTILTSNGPVSYGPAAICDLPGGIVLQDCSITSPIGAYISGGTVKASNGSLAMDVTITSNEGITTDINQVQSSKFFAEQSGKAERKVKSEEWYTIDGQKLNGKPTKKGVYIHNGKKVMR